MSQMCLAGAFKTTHYSNSLCPEKKQYNVHFYRLFLGETQACFGLICKQIDVTRPGNT